MGFVIEIPGSVLLLTLYISSVFSLRFQLILFFSLLPLLCLGPVIVEVCSFSWDVYLQELVSNGMFNISALFCRGGRWHNTGPVLVTALLKSSLWLLSSEGADTIRSQWFCSTLFSAFTHDGVLFTSHITHHTHHHHHTY